MECSEAFFHSQLKEVNEKKGDSFSIEGEIRIEVQSGSLCVQQATEGSEAAIEEVLRMLKCLNLTNMVYID